ncbi:MAG: hypothetical protein ABEI74_00160 [Candidatus Pacearchaeota archaeon]
MKKRAIYNIGKKILPLAVPFIFFSGGEPSFFKESGKLKINEDDNQTFLVKKEEKSGLRDIEEMLKKSEYEEAWIHFPKNKKWYGVGETSFLGGPKDDYAAAVVVNYKKATIAYNRSPKTKRATYIHNHPHGGAERMPSSGDLDTYESLYNRYKETNGLDAHLLGKIAYLEDGSVKTTKFGKVQNEEFSKPEEHTDSLYDAISEKMEQAFDRKSDAYFPESGFFVDYEEFGQKNKYGRNIPKTYLGISAKGGSKNLYMPK